MLLALAAVFSQIYNTMSSNKSNNIQDLILNHVRKKKADLMVYLSNGVPLKGRITSFDNFTFIIENEGKQSLVYKHAVSTIVFPKDIRIDKLSLEASKEENAKQEDMQEAKSKSE